MEIQRTALGSTIGTGHKATVLPSWVYGSDLNDTLNTEQQGAKFVVCNTERGTRSGELEFPSEAGACDYFLELTRRVPPRANSSS